MTTLWNVLTDSRLGSAASVLGLFLSLIGFGLTLWNVKRSRTAAEEARAAAERTQRELLKFDAVQDITSAIATMEEIKRLLRQRALAVLPDRYQTVRKHLISIRGSFPGLTDDQRSTLQSAIQQCAGAERLLDSPSSANDVEKLVGKLVRVVSSELDSLLEVLVAMRSSRGN